MDDTITIVDYNPDWVILFEKERILLKTIFEDFIDIQHIGSTSIYGLEAKPIIDIMLGVSERTLVDKKQINMLELNGYKYRGEAGIPNRQFFRKGMPRTHHLHVVKYKSDFWLEHLLFRNYLRAFPKVAEEYGRLKKRLVLKYSDDRGKYTKGKGPFINEVLEKAEMWMKERGDVTVQ
ncbi:GrpB-like predicted nucleotidyltransferase (UPF0157 family) [Sporomusa sp. KB1]|nr:GrpB-like predicted nucleotidyltransferase (UPF0157 family) [Sporomusa sp. KB1]